MKAISIYQPTATAVALGAKLIETRPWATSYRGDIAIHAAKHWNIQKSIVTKSSWTWCGILRPLGVRMGGGEELDELLAFGAVIAVATLVDCRPTGSFTVDELDTRRRPKDYNGESGVLEWTERMLGDFSPGRFGFVLENIRRLESPIVVRGRQRIFNLDPTTAAVVRNGLLRVA